jgi:hypothetical protein
MFEQSTKRGRDITWQVCQVFRCWRHTVLEVMLAVDEVPKILQFCEHVMNRQLSLYAEYKT